MSFLVSDSIKEIIDEETYVSRKSSDSSIVIDGNNLIKIKNKKNGNVIIDINLTQSQLTNLSNIDVFPVEMLNIVYEKIRVKQIIKDWDKYKCRLICKEKKIENN